MAEHRNEEINIIVNQMVFQVLLGRNLPNGIPEILISQQNDLEENMFIILLPKRKIYYLKKASKKKKKP